MPIKVTCTGCGVTLSTPDSSAGKRAKCPQCGSAIEIPAVQEEDYEVEPLAVEPAAAETAADSADRRPCPACGEMIMREAIKCRFCSQVFDRSMQGALSGAGRIDSEAWSKVSSGLAILYNCVGIAVGTLVLLFLGGVAMGAMRAGQRNVDPPVALVIVFAVAGLLVIGASIGMLVGMVRCTNVPQESGAHGCAVGAIVCIVGNFLLSLAGRAAESEAIAAIGSLVSLIGWVLFILFIRRSAAYLRDYELASSAGKFLGFMVLMMGVAIALFLLAASGPPVLLGLGGFCVLIASLVGLIWFLRLVRGLRMTIDDELQGPGLGAFA